ncbi:MAG TPA: DNA gyrase modulator, partial [Bacilli bacterium]|nr:DNA gyrase modulator [Bacilli bacterium]
MNFEVFIQKAMTKGLSAVEIYHTASEETMISLFNGAVDKAEIKNSNVYSVRGIYKGKMAYVTFENEAEDSDNLIAKLIENAESLTTDEEFEIFAGSKEYPKWETVDGGFSQATMTDKIKLIKDVEHIASNMDKRVTFLPYCGYSEEKVST